MEKKTIDYFHDITSSFKKLAKTPVRKLGVDQRHDLRVLVRREQAVIKLSKSSISKKRYKSVIKGLKNLEGSLGKLRELDVARRDAKIYGMNDKRLVPLKMKTVKLIKKKISTKARSKILHKLVTIQEHLYKHPQRIDRDRILKLRNKLGRCLLKKIFDKKELHSFRILIKETRYTLEACSRNTDQLIALQEDLGKIHDLETLEQLLNKSSQTTENGETLKAKVLGEKDQTIRSAIFELESLI